MQKITITDLVTTHKRHHLKALQEMLWTSHGTNLYGLFNEYSADAPPLGPCLKPEQYLRLMRRYISEE